MSGDILLTTYLNDHLAGARFALELLENLRNDQGNVTLRNLAEELLYEIDEDRQVLEHLVKQLDLPQNKIKESAAWLAQKASLWKLGQEGSLLGTFESLETLSLGIMGKLALWRALRVLQEIEPTFFETDFEQLCKRAERQFCRVERLRIKLIPHVFGRNRAPAIVA